MSSALGILKWSPDQFWACTMYEYTAAMVGHMKASGADMTPAPSRSEVEKAMAQHDKRVKASKSAR